MSAARQTVGHVEQPDEEEEENKRRRRGSWWDENILIHPFFQAGITSETRPFDGNLLFELTRRYIRRITDPDESARECDSAAGFATITGEATEALDLFFHPPPSMFVRSKAINANSFKLLASLEAPANAALFTAVCVAVSLS